jgi:hypothetical protein
MKKIEIIKPFDASVDDGLTVTHFGTGIAPVPEWLAKLAIKKKWAKNIKVEKK